MIAPVLISISDYKRRKFVVCVYANRKAALDLTECRTTDIVLG